MSLKQKAFSAGRWTAASAAIVAVLQILQTTVLARLIAPAEFGVMAVASAVIAILTLVVDMGLSRALIHFDDVPQSHLSSLYWVNMFLALVLMVLDLALAPIMGSLYKSTALIHLLQATSLAFPLAAFGQQMRTLAEKELRFQMLARVDISAIVVATGAAVTVAFLGGGVYSLVAGLLVKVGTSSLLVWWFAGDSYRPSLHFSLYETRRYLRYGIYLLGDSIANNIGRDADVFIGGFVVGPAAIGVYSVPRDLSLRLALLINPIITRVGFPVMSRAKGDRPLLASVYLQTLRMTASVNFPVYVAVGLFASEVVALLYGPKWRDAAFYLQLLSAWGLLRSIGSPVGSLLYAVGAARRAFWWNLTLMLVGPPICWVVAHFYGLPGLAICMLSMQFVVVIPAWKLLVYPYCGVRLQDYLNTFSAPLYSALIAGLLAWLVTRGIPHGTLRLAIGSIVGTTSYIALSYFFNRAWVTAMLELLHPIRSEQA